MNSTVFTKKYFGIRQKKNCGVNRFAPRFSKINYLIYFCRFIGNFGVFSKNAREAGLGRGKSVRSGEPVRAALVHM